MRFFDKRILIVKLNSVMVPRNAIHDTQHPLVIINCTGIGMFIGKFYEGLAEDANTKEILHELAAANGVQLDGINKLLAFWWCWSWDRFEGRPFLSNEKWLESLRTVWGFSEVDIEQMTKHFDAKQPLALNELWRMICGLLYVPSLSPVFAFIHLRNALVETMREVEEFASEIETRNHKGS